MNINPFLQSVVFVFETSEALTEQALCSRQIFQLVSIRSSKPEHKTALPSTPPALTRSPHSETTRQLDLNLEIIQPLWVQQIRCFAHGCCASKVNAQLHMSLGTWLSYGKKGWLCHVVNHMVDSLTDWLFVCLMHEDMDYVYYRLFDSSTIDIQQTRVLYADGQTCSLGFYQREEHFGYYYVNNVFWF